VLVYFFFPKEKSRARVSESKRESKREKEEVTTNWVELAEVEAIRGRPWSLFDIEESGASATQQLHKDGPFGERD